MTNYFTSETLSVIGDSVFLGSTVLGAYALIGGDNIIMDDVNNTISLTQDVSINTLKVASILDLSGELRADGGIKCDTDKFTVENGTGNTNIGGTLTIGNNQFSVESNTGNTNISGLVSVNSTVSDNKAYRTYLNSAETFYVQMNGNVWAQAVTTYSDSRLKHNKETLQGLEVIRKLKPTKYDKTNTENEGDAYIQEAGFIAQEVLETDISWAVNESQTDKKYYGLNYNSVFTYGIQAIKELDEQLNLEKEKTKLLQEELQKTNQELINAKLDIEKSKFEIQYIKNILEIV